MVGFSFSTQFPSFWDKRKIIFRKAQDLSFVLNFGGISGVDQRSFGSRLNVFHQGFLLVLAIRETAAVGAFDSIPFSLFLYEYFNFVYSGFIIHACQKVSP